ncbi:MAG: hypothetical protein IPO77_09800 [Acidobacteria bacterium]|nr:hypothetical protein [Acidobacteriota bacterium]
MSRRTSTMKKILTLALMMTVGSFYSLVTTSAFAQTAQKSAGELSVTGSVSMNGTSAISGATIFSDSKIKTSRNSGATINLGKLGRVQLGPESEMVVRFNDGNVGGNLTSGRAVVSAPEGVSISVVTAEGIASADGKQASTVTVDVTCGNTRVASARSNAKVTSGAKVETVAAGSEVSVGAQGGPRCARLSTAGNTQGLSAGAIAALIIAGVGGGVAGIIAAAQSDNVTPSSIVVSGFRP